MQFCPECNRTYPADFRFCPRHNIPLQGREELAVGMIVREKYKILKLIGDGAMGRVWLIEDLDFTYRTVHKAMKVPLGHLATDPAYIQRFRDEAAKAGALHHPNVVRTEHIDRTESGTPFLLMELVEGQSLRFWLRRRPKQLWIHAAEIARQIACALEAAHSAGLVHCDIKPENVLSIGDQGPYPLKVTDFGLAKAIGTLIPSPNQTAPGTTWGNDVVAGTPAYISPEQALSRGNVGPPTDIYSLGVILYEMLAGHLPYGPVDTVEQARVFHQQAPPNLEDAAEFPPSLVSLVFQMMAHDPGQRPTAAAVVAALGRIMAENKPATGASTDPQAVPQPRPFVPPPPGPAAAAGPGSALSAASAAAAPAASPAPVALAATTVNPPAAGESTTPPVHFGTGSAGHISGDASNVAAAIVTPKPKSNRTLVLALALAVGVIGVAVLAWTLLAPHNREPQHIAIGGGASPSGPGAVTPSVKYPDSPQPTVSLPSPATETPDEPAPAAKNPPPQTPKVKTEDPAEAESLYQQGKRQLAANDREAARQSFEQAANRGHVESMRVLGAIYTAAKQYDQALTWFQKAARAGNARSMYWLGDFYEKGLGGLTADLNQAISWYKKAAQRGDTDAQSRLQALGQTP